MSVDPYGEYPNHLALKKNLSELLKMIAASYNVHFIICKYILN